MLDEMLRTAGRNPSDVKRTVMLSFTFTRDMEELDRHLSSLKANPHYAGKSLDEIIEELGKNGTIVGTPDMIVEQIGAYGRVGTDELVLQWMDLDDIDGLRAFARSVLPRM